MRHLITISTGELVHLRGVENGQQSSHPQPTKGLGEHHKGPVSVQGGALAANAFW